jgi:hypothetical protein
MLSAAFYRVDQQGADEHRRPQHLDVAARTGPAAVKFFRCKKKCVEELRAWGAQDPAATVPTAVDTRLNCLSPTGG